MKKPLFNGKEVEFIFTPLNHNLKSTNQSKYLIIPEKNIDRLINLLKDFKKTEGYKSFLAIKGIEKDFDILDDEPVIADMSLNGEHFGMCYFTLDKKLKTK
tara:strand:- start:286 stop:588 length:303 start_codon:yes stop_codon:yes gene_type:complete